MLERWEGELPCVDGSAFVAPTAVVIGRVAIGARASVWYGAVLRGDIHRIEIGEESNVQDGSVLHVSDDHPCVVGPRVTVGHMAVVHAATVAEGALVGIQAVVLDGARIGEGAIVAAGALVPPGFEVPPRTLVAGVPARPLREVREEERLENLWRVEKYVRLSRRYLGRDAGPLVREPGWRPSP